MKDVLLNSDASRGKVQLTLDVGDCGLAGYREMLELQHSLREQKSKGLIANTVLIVEHKPVITLGARQSANKLLFSRQELENRKIDVVEIRRGGGTTAHNPGQLVFYPILDLRQFGLGVNEYVRKLEAIGMKLLEELGVRAEVRKGFPGLWIEGRKIASIGVRVSRFITCHGMAININNDLDIFDLIVPCGLDGIQITSVLVETGKKSSMSVVKDKLKCLLLENFS